MYVPRRIAPSFASGFARSAAESAAPELWPTRAWLPALGVQGGVLHDIAGKTFASIVAGSTRGLWVGSPYGMAFEDTDGTSDYYNTGVFPTLTRDLTVLTVASPSATNANLHVLGCGTNADWSFRVGHTNAAKWVAACVLTSGGAAAYTATEPTATAVNGKWQPVFAVFQQNVSTRLYVDGRLSAETASPKTGLRNASTNIRLMGQTATIPAATFDGAMAVTYLWDRTLTAQEIAELSRDPSLPFRLRRRAVGKAPAGGTTAELAASIEGEGDVTGAASGTAGAAASIEGEGDLTGQASGTAAGAATVEGDGDATGQAAGTAGAAATLEGEGDVAGAATGIAGAAATIEGEGDATGQVSGIASGAATIEGEGDVTGQPSAVAEAAASIEGEGDVTGAIIDAESVVYVDPIIVVSPMSAIITVVSPMDAQIEAVSPMSAIITVRSPI